MMKKTLITLAVTTALTACQNLEQDEQLERKEAKQEKELVELVIVEEKPVARIERRAPLKPVPNHMSPRNSGEETESGTNIEDLLDEVRKQGNVQSQVNKKREANFTANGMHYQSRAVDMHLLPENLSGENYHQFEDNPISLVTEKPVSTFSIDVDTASYANVRRMLNDGYLPPKDSVRLEEFVNYFDYDYLMTSDSETPFSVNTQTMVAPWNKDAHLIQVGIKGYEPIQEKMADSNLVFLVDVSGSMQNPKKLGLVKKSLKLLTKQLSESDKVSLVVYAGASGVVLEPTSGKEKMKIEQAIDQLQAGGSTNGGAGIELAYRMAEQAFIEDGINRVILATDGDFNVGLTNHNALIDLIESKRKTNIFFSSLGFGSGNYNDHLMEQLANKGNGNAAYIDSLLEAKKVLVDERAGTLLTIAKDVKIQVEFNPQIVSEYRLLGYENRILKREDFNNDKVDAGEIGAGHTVTALYEVVLKNSKGKRVDPLRYQTETAEVDISNRRLALEAAMVKLRYKLPDGDSSRLIERPLYASELGNSKANRDIKFAASVAAFGQLLRGSDYLGDWNWQKAIEYSRKERGDDPSGYRAEMIKLMEMAQLLSGDSTSDTNNKVSMNIGKSS